MSGLRFKVGDLARVVVAMNPKNQGRIIEIGLCGPFFAGQFVKYGDRILKFYFNADYLHGDKEQVSDWQLQPINPPAEPASMTRETDCEVEA